MKKRRLILLVLAGVVTLAVAVRCRYLWLSRPIGTGPAGPSVARTPFETTWTTRPVLLLGLGDSVTAGFGASRGRSYFQRLVANPVDEFPDLKGICLSAVLPGLDSNNMSVSGSTSLEHLQMLEDNRLEIQDPQVLGIVVMTTGGNDIIHAYGRMPPREGAMYGASFAEAGPWIENFGRRLDRMIGLIEERFPGGCHIFLADIYDPTDSVGDAQNAGLPRWDDGLAILQAYNRLIHRCAKQRANVHLVSMHDEFLGHGIHCTQPWRDHYRPLDPHYWYADNLEDPNDRGYDALRRLFLIEIAKLAGELRGDSESQDKSALTTSATQ